MSGERLSVWDDERVKERLAEGMQPADIAILNCPSCGKLSYYNQGSWFTCHGCNATWHCKAEDEEPDDRPTIWLSDGVLTLDDAIEAECSDY